jgi:hypothetical protein
VLAAAQRNGEQISQEQINRIAGSYASSTKLTFKTYNQADITTTPDLSEETITTYLSELIKNLSNQPPAQRNPLSVVATNLQNDKDERIDLSAYISQTTPVINQLRNQRVPQTYAGIHLELLNSLQKGLDSLMAMQSIETDPIRGILAVRAYKNSLNDSDNAIQQLTTQVNNDLR